MDDQVFDRLARLAARGAPRRRLLGALGAAAIAGTGLGATRRGSAAAEAATPAAGHQHGNGLAQPAATPESGALWVRKNGKDLSAAERQALVNAILAVKKKPSPWMHGLSVYDTFVLWHRDAFGCAIMAGHMGPAFLPWHRQFLITFERELQAIEPTVTIPYWDWTVDNTLDAYLWADDFLGGNGDPAEGFALTNGPFRKDAWHITVFDPNDRDRFPYLIRQLGATSFAPALPTPEDLEAALSIPTYDAAPWNTVIPTGGSFRNVLEGWQDCVDEICDPDNGMAPICTGPHNLHNGVHLWIAGEFAFSVEGARDGERGNLVVAEPPHPATDVFGTMAANVSLNDPVFWLHHANIDRIWNEWMRRHGQVYLPESGGPVGHNIDDAMWPFTMLGETVTPRMMLSSRDLGYVYDTEL